MLVETLANSRVFQRFAVWSHRTSKELTAKSECASRDEPIAAALPPDTLDTNTLPSFPPALSHPNNHHNLSAKDHAEVLDRFAEAAKNQARALKQEFEQQLKAQQMQQQQGGGGPGRPR